MSQLLSILNKLYAGKKIVLEFNSIEDQESFRQRIYKIKKDQDEGLVNLLDETKQVLRHERVSDEKVIRSTYWMEAKKELNFSIISIENIEPDKKESDGRAGRQKTLSGTLGNDTEFVSQSSVEGSSDSIEGQSSIQENSKSGLEGEES